MKKYTNIFKIKEIPREINNIQNIRRSGQWEYTFKSLNNVRIKLTVDNKTTEINNLDSEVDKIMNALNDSNRENFINELSEIYVASKLANETKKDIQILDMHFGRLKRDKEYNKKRNEILEGIPLSMSLKEKMSAMIQRIANKYLSIERNKNMELDNLMISYGIFEQLALVNNYIKNHPNDKISVLSRKYINYTQDKYLTIINNSEKIINSNNFKQDNRNFAHHGVLGRIKPYIKAINLQIKNNENIDEDQRNDAIDILNQGIEDIKNEKINNILKIKNFILDNIKKSKELPNDNLPKNDEYLKKLEEVKKLIEDRLKEFKSRNTLKSIEELIKIENQLNDFYKKSNNFLKSPDSKSFNEFKNSLINFENDLNPQKKLSSINYKFIRISPIR